MKHTQLEQMQKKRLIKKKRPTQIEIQKCYYCGEILVRLRTIARCYEVLQLEKNHVIWIDQKGYVRRNGIMTKDHFIPKSKGGSNSKDNIVCSCIPCNNKKGNFLAAVSTKGDIIFGEKLSLKD
jgi:5-methylcytosine-specific restriction endonuclease McrA